MANFILIALCITAGIFFRRSGKLPKDAHKGINAWIINIALPAVSFKYLPYISWSRELLIPALAPVLVWLCGWLYITLYTRSRKQMSRATSGGLKLVTGLSNTSFVGFPLITAYFGEQQLGIAIISDQVTFMLLATIGIVVAIRSSQQEELRLRTVAKRLVRFPPLICCVLALLLPHYINLSPLQPLFDKLAATVGPLALFSIGLQLKFAGWRSEIRHISVALAYKLIIAPALVLGLVYICKATGIVGQISIFEMAMPTLLTSGIIADQYNLNPRLSNLVIGLGIVSSFITTGLWWLLLHYML